MTTDKILYDVLCTLYPDVGFETEAIVILVGLTIVTIVAFASACLLIWLDDRSDAPAAVALGTSALLAIFWIAFYSAAIDDKKDRLVRELVNDPAALPVVQELRYDLEWVKDPKIQRNAGETK